MLRSDDIDSNPRSSVRSISSINDDARLPNEITALLSLLSENPDNPELRPALRPELGGVVYDLGSGFNIPYEKLKPTEKKGILKRVGFTSFPACPKCKSLNLQTRLGCPDCKSQAIFKSDLLVHYECQNTGPVEEFQSSVHNGYYCQKCRKELKRVGIDYGNPGIGFKCSACEKVFQFPLVMSHCGDNHASKIDELDLSSYPNYIIGENAKGLSILLSETQTLKKALEKENIRSQILVQLRGASGANHVIPLLLIAPSGEQVAIEFITDESQIEQAILQLLLKSADLPKTRMIIVCKSSSPIDHITKVVNPLKVKVLLSAEISLLSRQIIQEVIR